MKEDKKRNWSSRFWLEQFFELATTNESYVNGLKLHENKNETLEDYTGDFELIGSLMIGETEQKNKY